MHTRIDYRKLKQGLIALIQSFDSNDGVHGSVYEATKDIVEACLGTEAKHHLDNLVSHDLDTNHFYFEDPQGCSDFLSRWLE